MKPAGAQAMERIQHPERRVERRFPCRRPNLMRRPSEWVRGHTRRGAERTENQRRIASP